MAKNEVKNAKERMSEWSRIPKQNKPYIFVRLMREKECIKPTIHAYGSEIDSLVKAAVEAFDKVYQEYTQKGYNVAPLTRMKRPAAVRLNKRGGV